MRSLRFLQGPSRQQSGPVLASDVLNDGVTVPILHSQRSLGALAKPAERDVWGNSISSSKTLPAGSQRPSRHGSAAVQLASAGRPKLVAELPAPATSAAAAQPRRQLPQHQPAADRPISTGPPGSKLQQQQVNAAGSKAASRQNITEQSHSHESLSSQDIAATAAEQATNEASLRKERKPIQWTGPGVHSYRMRLSFEHHLCVDVHVYRFSGAYTQAQQIQSYRIIF